MFDAHKPSILQIPPLPPFAKETALPINRERWTQGALQQTSHPPPDLPLEGGG